MVDDFQNGFGQPFGRYVSAIIELEGSSTSNRRQLLL